MLFLIQAKNAKRRCEQCKLQRSTKDNKTTAVCDLCLAPTCTTHYVRVCEPCYLHKFKDSADFSEAEHSDDDDNDDDQIASTSNEPPTKNSRISTINLQSSIFSTSIFRIFFYIFISHKFQTIKHENS